MRPMVRRCLARHTGLAAYLALFLALGGTAYAAVTVTGENIVDGSVKSADIGDGEVKYGDLAMNSVHSSKVFDESLQSQDIRDETLESPDIRDETLESRDIRNDSIGSADIAAGAVRRSELELDHHIVTAGTDVSEKIWRELTASCPDGETAISAGVKIKGDANNKPVVSHLYPIDSTTWFAAMRTTLDDYDASWGFRMSLTCVSI